MTCVRVCVRVAVCMQVIACCEAGRCCLAGPWGTGFGAALEYDAFWGDAGGTLTSPIVAEQFNTGMHPCQATLTLAQP